MSDLIRAGCVSLLSGIAALAFTPVAQAHLPGYEGERVRNDNHQTTDAESREKTATVDKKDVARKGFCRAGRPAFVRPTLYSGLLPVLVSVCLLVRLVL